jgi:hypothetical protein
MDQWRGMDPTKPGSIDQLKASLPFAPLMSPADKPMP